MQPESPAIDITILRKAGLTESQAKGYLALIEHGQLTPAELAEHTGESRTNGYMICEKLEKLGLATKKDGKTARYTPNHPSALETLAEKRRKAVQANEQAVKNNLGALIAWYYEKAEKPGVRYLEGPEGQVKVYDDIIAQKQPMYLIRTPNEKKFLGKDVLYNVIAERQKYNIPVKALTPYTTTSNTDPQKDEQNLLQRQFMPEDLYTAPVEIDIYGNRTSFISFGEELNGLIIDNPHIADAMRQVFDLAQRGAEAAMQERPDLVQQLQAARAAHSADDQRR